MIPECTCNPCEACERPGDVGHLLNLARTKQDLQDLVGMLHRRNLRLQDVRDDLAHQLAQARKTGRTT